MSDMSWALPWNWGPAGQQYGAQAQIDANLAANQAAAAANAAAVQAASQAAAASTGYNPVYQSPVGFGDYNYGTVQSYPSFSEAQNYGGQNDPFSGGYSPYQQAAPQQPVSGTTPAYVGGQWRSLQDLTPEQQYQWSQLNGVPYNPFEQYNNGGYDPFSPQSYQPAAQPNVGDWGSRNARAGFPAAAPTPPDPGRFGPAELPPQITEDPTFSNRWSPSYDPYRNPPLNNELWRRGMDAGPQQPPDDRYTPAGDLLRSDLYWNGSAAVPRTDGATGYQRDAIAQEMMRSSIPSQPTANQGYNPGMEQWFANPRMQQWPSQVPQGPQIDDLQRLLEEINRTQGYDQSGNVGNSTAGG